MVNKNIRQINNERLQYQITKRLIQHKRFDNKLILDVGSGRGEFSNYLKEKGASIICIENDKDCIKELKKEFNVLDLDLEKAKLPFKDNTFDYIFILDVIEHVLNCDDLLKELKRILKVNGKIFMTTPDSLHWKYKIKYLLNNFDLFAHPTTHRVFFDENSYISFVLKQFNNFYLYKSYQKLMVVLIKNKYKK